MKWLAVMLLISGCAAPTAPPVDLASCPAAPAVPAGVRPVRTSSQVADFATRLELAREAERRRGDLCADRLHKLNNWIRAHPQ